MSDPAKTLKTMFSHIRAYLSDEDIYKSIILSVVEFLLRQRQKQYFLHIWSQTIRLVLSTTVRDNHSRTKKTLSGNMSDKAR